MTEALLARPGRRWSGYPRRWRREGLWTFFFEGEGSAPAATLAPDGTSGSRPVAPDARVQAVGCYEAGRREGLWLEWAGSGELEPERSGTYVRGERVRTIDSPRLLTLFERSGYRGR